MILLVDNPPIYSNNIEGMLTDSLVEYTREIGWQILSLVSLSLAYTF